MSGRLYAMSHCLRTLVTRWGSGFHHNFMVDRRCTNDEVRSKKRGKSCAPAAAECALTCITLRTCNYYACAQHCRSKGAQCCCTRMIGTGCRVLCPVLCRPRSRGRRLCYARPFSACNGSTSRQGTMAEEEVAFQPRAVKDVPPEAFIEAYAAHLKTNDKVGCLLRRPSRAGTRQRSGLEGAADAPSRRHWRLSGVAGPAASKAALQMGAASNRTR